MSYCDSNTSLGKRLGIAILTARVHKNLSREALSELIYRKYNAEITPKTIGRVEGGRTNPTMKTLSLLIASLLDEELHSLENIALTLFQVGEQRQAQELPLHRHEANEMSDD